MVCEHCGSEKVHLLQHDSTQVICQMCGKLTEIKRSKRKIKNKMKIVKNSGTHQVLKFLSDGKIHKITELLKPSNTHRKRILQIKACYSWFRRATRKGYAKKVSKLHEAPSKWQITEKGRKVLGMVK